jgi:hypothetical protein
VGEHGILVHNADKLCQAAIDTFGEFAQRLPARKQEEFIASLAKKGVDPDAIAEIAKHAQISPLLVRGLAAPRVGKLVAGTDAHKAARWQEYVDSFNPGGARHGKKQWTYDHWSKQYDLNMTRASVADEFVIDYQGKLGWGRRQVTVDADGLPRKLDIADKATRRGVEVKSSVADRRFSLSPEVSSEIARDKWLVEHGWDIEWNFNVRMGITDGLREALEAAGIRITGL